MTRSATEPAPPSSGVYFDDFKVTMTPTAVVQRNEYYPFGLQHNTSWTRDNGTNNFLYNEGSELNTTTGVYDTPFRGYDPALGRFMQVDPLALYAHDVTPYHYAGNNPILYNDPSGLVVPAQASTWTESQLRGYYYSHEYGGVSMSFSDWMTDGGPNGGGGARSSSRDGGGGQSLQDFLDSHTDWVYDGQFYDPGTQTKVNRWSLQVTNEGTWASPDGSDFEENADDDKEGFDPTKFIPEGLPASMRPRTMGGNTVWHLDTRHEVTGKGRYGKTIPANPKDADARIDVYIDPDLFKLSKNAQKAVIGHEWVHVSHYRTGAYLSWLTKYNRSNGVAENISEMKAWLWNYNTYPIDTPGPPSAKTMFDSYLSQTPRGFTSTDGWDDIF